mgnify:CR=1 FL=1
MEPLSVPDPAVVAAHRASVAAVRRRIASAAARAGRDAAEVRLVAVTKYVGPDVIAALAAAGVPDVGENRTGPLLEKRAALGAALTWHMIGHLQRNKVRRALPAVDVLHAGDSLRLLRALDDEVERAGRAPLPVLVQVNAGGEASKGGFAPDATAAAVAEARSLRHLRLRGLMTMAPEVDDPEDVRPVFRILRELRDELASRGYLDGRELSMGMSGDFEIAVEEGATMVRIGRVLYGGVST